MGVLPLQFVGGATRKSLGLDGSETVDLLGQGEELRPGQEVTIRIRRGNGQSEEVKLLSRIDTVNEINYYINGGILNYVLQQLLA